ncbi:hypothetical protein DOTSEDRAFT_73780 [Dothistroma septosporum NZE10]|uniref:Uncharacterized protein n=1 Tax=Dothistroma septosporum (strain NZE10 / CBS 128990) TaxID=675120 RepID=N1PH64_DOTSN|nr:hypothetical protein DOTSEDRAFT_73780 [Dothistroma septosporum NZE10]
MRISGAHIAGVGLSTGGNACHHDLAVSAGTKALLDAGATYSDVNTSIACFLDNLRVPRSCFDLFGMNGTAVSEVDNRSGLLAAVQSIRSGQSNCVLAVGFDQAFEEETTSQVVLVAVVIVSDLFLTSHAYLRDSAVCIRGASLTNRVYSRSSSGPDHQHSITRAVQAALRQAQLERTEIQVLEVRSRSAGIARQALSGEFDFTPREPPSKLVPLVGTTGLAGLCAIVWQLRGWTGDPPARIVNCLQATVDSDGATSAFVLRRSDDKPAQAWSEIKNLRDGRERLAYNPADGNVRDISHEDLLAVRAQEEFTQDDAKHLQLRVKGGDRAALARL